MKNPVLFFEIIDPDAVPLKRFYADLFGWRRVSIYARIDDLQGYLDEVGQLDGKLVTPPTESDGLTFVHVADPAGTGIGIYTD